MKLPCIVALYLIGPDVTRVGGVRAFCEVDANGGSAEGFMSPVYAFMRCVDNALIGQPMVATEEERYNHVMFG